MTKTRYQLPVAEDREQSVYSYVPSYRAPDTPLEIPVESDAASVEREHAPITVDDAIPVRVMEFAKEPDRFRDARMFQLAVEAGKTVALPRRSQRVKVTLVNTHASLNVYLGHDPTVNSLTGFPLRPTDPPLSLETQRSYYLHNGDAVDTVMVGVIDEFTTELM